MTFASDMRRGTLEEEPDALRADQDAALGQALVDVDKLTHAVPEGAGSRLYLGAQHLDVPHTLDELGNVLAGRDREDGGEQGGAGFHVR